MGAQTRFGQKTNIRRFLLLAIKLQCCSCCFCMLSEFFSHSKLLYGFSKKSWKHPCFWCWGDKGPWILIQHDKVEKNEIQLVRHLFYMHRFSFFCWVKVCSGCFRQVLFAFEGPKKWLLVVLDKWSSYTGTIAWKDLSKKKLQKVSRHTQHIILIKTF